MLQQCILSSETDNENKKAALDFTLLNAKELGIGIQTIYHNQIFVRIVRCLGAKEHSQQVKFNFETFVYTQNYLLGYFVPLQFCVVYNNRINFIYVKGEIQYLNRKI